MSEHTKSDVPIAAKVAHVKRAGQTRRHTCHWPGCKKQVPPAMWGCKEHWYSLPEALRRKVWRAYSPGQEERLDPSAEYVNVAREVEWWIRSQRGVSPVQLRLKGGPAYAVREYLGQLGWDSRPRLDRWLAVAFGADEAGCALGAAWMINAVRRAYEPGGPRGPVLTLAGPQGVGKTAAIRILAGPFLDTWIHEIAWDFSVEVAMLRQLSLEWPSSSFAVTTNPARPMRSVVCCERRLNMKALENDRDQLWAEAVARS